ncbi:MAG: DUF3223 domain-containing protein [Dechloromonas sp.]|nr:DUF3223 domain-containing protein [Dechloromonas sp.]
MVKPVKLSNGRQWRTQKEALEHFKQMLARYTNGDKITDSADHDDLFALLNRYDAVLAPGEETKAGAGIAYFSRERNVGDGWSTDGFHVHRTDGTSIDFSYISAVKSESSSSVTASSTR